LKEKQKLDSTTYKTLEIEKQMFIDNTFIEGVNKITDMSLHSSVIPGIICLVFPVTVGIVFGAKAVCGYLVGIIISGLQLGIFSTNTGAAWDNSKKFIESKSLKLGKFGSFKMKIDKNEKNIEQRELYRQLKKMYDKAKDKEQSTEKKHYMKDAPLNPESYEKNTKPHKASLIGDSVGDPLKDCCGPSINILMKLSSVIALIFGSYFIKHSWAKNDI
jgi:K(+)-stimulated pyrophosphate-energized sodium pump